MSLRTRRDLRWVRPISVVLVSLGCALTSCSSEDEPAEATAAASTRPTSASWATTTAPAGTTAAVAAAASAVEQPAQSAPRVADPVPSRPEQAQTAAAGEQKKPSPGRTGPSDNKPPFATVLLPAEKANRVDPQLGRIVLLLSDALSEPPADASLTLEVPKGTGFAPTAHTARPEFNPKTHEWKWRLSPPGLPENTELRVTLRAKGQQSIVWSFTTGTSGMTSKLPGLKGGCPIETTPPKPSALPDPCNKRP